MHNLTRTDCYKLTLLQIFYDHRAFGGDPPMMDTNGYLSKFEEMYGNRRLCLPPHREGLPGDLVQDRDLLFSFAHVLLGDSVILASRSKIRIP